jgi:predicted heme/steroid binding protein
LCFCLIFQEWTWEEVAQHNTPNDCFLVVDGKVYDVTTFISRHPGGEAIYKNAGKDNSVGTLLEICPVAPHLFLSLIRHLLSPAGFHGEQHGTSALEAIQEFHIGKVVDSKKSQ